MSDQEKTSTDGKILYCSFCGKSQHEVRKLIAGPSVYICDECVELCNDIIREELEERDYYTEENVFWVPKDARWSVLQDNARQPTIGQIIDDEISSVDDAPSVSYEVVPGDPAVVLVNASSNAGAPCSVL